MKSVDGLGSRAVRVARGPQRQGYVVGGLGKIWMIWDIVLYELYDL